MSRIVQLSDSLVIIPSGYTGNSNLTAGTGTQYQPSNGYHDHTGTASITTAARWTLTRSNAGYVYYTFSINEIPSTATITSVSCIAKIWVSSTSVTNTNIQLYTGTTAKGSSSTFLTTSSSNTVTLNTGTSWTLSEVNNIRLRFGGTGGANNRYIYFWGATLTINYSYEGTEYQVSVTNNSSVTVSPTGTNNWVAEGNNQVITFTNVTDVATLRVLDNNVNISNELVNTGTNRYTYTIENISVDHSIVLSIVTAYNITASSEISDIAAISPASGRAGHGSEYDLDIVTDDVIAIKVYDNNVDVTSQLVNKIILVPSSDIDTVSSIPTQYVEGTLTVYSASYPASNGLNSSSNTGTPARFYCDTANILQYTEYLFTINGIPANAVIDSVSCIIKAYTNGGNYFTIRRGQLYSGNTPKGDPSSNFGTTNTSTSTINSDDWTVNELQNIKLRLEGQSTQAGNSYRIYFYGADLTVTYRELEQSVSDTQYTYTISNVQAAHTVVIREAPYNQITGSSTFTGVSFTNLPKKIYVPSSNYSVGISGITNPYSYRLSDNNTDVTSSVNYFNGSVTLTPSQYLTGDSTPTNPNNALTDTSSTTVAQFNMNSSDQEWFYKFDTSSIPITAIIKSVTCKVRARNTRNTSSAYIEFYSGNTIKTSRANTSTTATTYTLTNISDWTAEELQDVRLRINDVYTGSTTTYYIELYGAELIVEYEDCSYTIQNITADHTLVLSEAPKYAVTGTSNFSGVTINGTGNVYQGDSITISLSGIIDPASFTLYDNNVNVTSSVNDSYQYTISNAQAAHILRVEENNYVTISGNSTFTGASFTNLPKKVYEANYGSDFTVNLTGISVQNSFILTDNDRYVTNFVDNNQYLIQNVEENHILVLLENTYYSVTGSSSVSGISITGTSNKVYEGNSITLTITGVSNIYSIKLSDNNVDVSEHIEYANNSYKYTIDDVYNNHTLTISQQDTVTITTSSNYVGATLSSSVSSVYKGESVTLTLDVSDISLVSIMVNNSTMITGIFEGTGPYIGVLENIRENLSIVVIEKVTYDISCTDNSTYGDITPTGIRTVDGGYDVEYRITTDYLNRIYLNDNNVIKNDELIHNPLLDGSTTLYINSYSNASSSGYSNFTTSTSYPISNAGDSSSDTSNYFRLRSATNNGQHEAWLEFNTSSLNNINIPEDIDLTVTCKVAFRVSSTSYISVLAVQLYSGNTPKGSATTTRTTTTTVYTLTVGNDWTLEELQNLRIRVTATHNNSTSNGDIRIYGADLTVAYHRDEYYSYILENVSGAHTLVLSDRPTYQLTSIVETENGTITPASVTIYENNNVEFIITTSDISKIKLLDNDTDVSDDIIYDDGNFKYIVESVSAIHTLVLKDKLTPYIKINSQFVAFSKIYKKISGSWVEQTTPDNLFESNKIYIRK